MTAADKLQVKIIGPDKILYDGEADYLSYPIEAGEKGVLPGHTRLIATLYPGEIKIREAGKEESFQIEKGLIRINRTHISLIIV